MKASAVAARINELIAQHGDMEMLIDGGVLEVGGLFPIDEIDIDTEDTGFIIWPDMEREADNCPEPQRHVRNPDYLGECNEGVNGCVIVHGYLDEALKPCSCFPKHCTDTSHGACWCGPTHEGNLIIHNQET